MKKSVKAVLILLVILTVIYVSAVVYANTNASACPDPHRCVLYAAFKYEADTSPSEWYTLEQLGICDVIEYVENGSWLHIAVDREKEPFPLQSENPIFLYKDEFYQVSSLHVTPALPEGIKNWQIPVGGALGIGWVFTGVLFLRWMKKE